MGQRGKGGLRVVGNQVKRSGLGRLVFWLLLVGGLVVVLLVLGALAIGIWLVVNADAALAWLNGVLAQLGPIVSLVNPPTKAGG